MPIGLACPTRGISHEDPARAMGEECAETNQKYNLCITFIWQNSKMKTKQLTVVVTRAVARVIFSLEKSVC